jgi:hypothetical protein
MATQAPAVASAKPREHAIRRPAFSAFFALHLYAGVAAGPDTEA